MEPQLERVFESVIARNPGEAEFHQAVREVFESLGAPAGRESLALLVETVSSADTSTLDELEQLIQLRRKELGS